MELQLGDWPNPTTNSFSEALQSSDVPIRYPCARVEHESEVHLERSFTQNPAPISGNFVRPAWQTVVELRSRRGWSQEKLAEKSILSVRTIQNLERGKSIHLGTIAKVAEALGVPPKDCITSPAPREALSVEIEMPPCP